MASSSLGRDAMDTLLYFGGRFDSLNLEALDGARFATDGSVHFAGRGPGGITVRRRLLPLNDRARVVGHLNHRPVDALLVDLRDDPRAGLELLDAIYPHGAVGGPLLKSRVLGMVGGGTAGIEAAFALGRRGIAAVEVDPSGPEIAAAAERLLAGRGHGKIAICLAGGGIEGLLYELGVLRAVESFLADRKIVDFDLFCGISAGAILGAFLANGIGPETIREVLEGRDHRLEPIARLDLFEPNLGEVGERTLGLLSGLARGGIDPRAWVSALTRSVPTAMLSGRRLGRWLERQLSRPGMSDTFEGLRRPLYVGATDQDTSEAVLFGEGARAGVPVHRAVQASCALVPFYPPVEIGGRYYVDGAFSRTTNMRVAANRGATLVLLVDPLVPVRASEAGYVRARGGIFAGTQGLKALINGRFDKAVHAIREMHPEVAFHLFRPEGDEMRILSGSPMKYFYRREVEQIAYETTLAKLRAALPQLERDFALHGVRFRDPDEPTAVHPSRPTLSATSLGV